MQQVITGSQQLTSSQLAAACKLTIPAGTERARIQCVGGVVRYTLDGVTTPTANLGNVLPDSSASGASESTLELMHPAIDNAQFIKDSGATPTVEVTYFGMG